MERLKRVIELLPEFVSAGLLDASGGNLAVRTSKGVYVSPSQAGEELRWRLSLDDFVLFPGAGEASMARAGRHPSRENRIHRAVLAARDDWSFSYIGSPWGMLGFALAYLPLPVSLSHSRLINRHKAVDIPVMPEMPAALPELSDHCAEAMKRTFHDCPHGAVLLAGLGVMVAGAEPESTLSVIQMLENCARAQTWLLKGS